MPSLPNYQTIGMTSGLPGLPRLLGGMNQIGQPGAPLGPYGPNADMTWEQANQYQAGLLRNAQPQLVTGGNMGGGPGTYRWPSNFDPYSDLRSQSDRDQQAMRNSFSNTQGQTFGFMANPSPSTAMQAPAQRTRVYGPSFSLPRYGGRNS